MYYFKQRKSWNTARWRPGSKQLGCGFCRIEKVRLDRKDGIAKVLGTACCVAGATIITLYQGPVIYSPSTKLHETTPMLLSLGDANGKSWTLGCLFLIGHCLSWSAWLVFQSPILKKYPARLSVTSYTCFFGLIQFIIIALIFERDFDAWMFHSGGELFTIMYAVSNSIMQTLTIMLYYITIIFVTLNTEFLLSDILKK